MSKIKYSLLPHKFVVLSSKQLLRLTLTEVAVCFSAVGQTFTTLMTSKKKPYVQEKAHFWWESLLSTFKYSKRVYIRSY